MKNCANCGGRGLDRCIDCTTGNPPSMWTPEEKLTEAAPVVACFNCKHEKLIDGSFEGGLLECRLSGKVYDLLRVSDCKQYEDKTEIAKKEET